MKRTVASQLSPEHPFAGLRPFDYADREYFFGRKEQAYALYRLLDRSQFVAVIGSSGSGKSSLVRAGLLQLISDQYETIVLRPGNSPLSSLAGALADFAKEVDAEESLIDLSIRRELIDFALARSSFGIVRALEHVPRVAGRPMLLLVDQFEELFRYATASSRNESFQFVQRLLEGSRAPGKLIRVLITMRSDFIGDCAQFHGLPEAVSTSQYLVPSLRRDQYEEAIRGPAEKAGGTVDSDLVEQLLNDVGSQSEQLPVLQHLLMRMWELSGPTRALTLELYGSEKIGGIAHALSRHADHILAEIGNDLAVEQVFRALSELDKDGRAVRRPISFSQLINETGIDEKQVRRVVDRLRANDCCFLVPPSARPLLADTIVDVAHEALLRLWKRVSNDPQSENERGWIYAEEEDGRFYQALLALLKGEDTVLPLNQVEWRWQWWTSRPRTKAWAQRYGGMLSNVEHLFLRSRDAVSRERQSKESEAQALWRCFTFINDRNLATDILQGLAGERELSRETSWLFGRVYKDQYFEAMAAGSAEAAQDFLSKSIEFYDRAHRAAPDDPYPLLDLCVLLALSGQNANERLNELRDSISPWTHTISADYWDAATALEFAILGSDANAAATGLQTLLASGAPRSHFQSTASRLSVLRHTGEAVDQGLVEGAIQMLLQRRSSATADAFSVENAQATRDLS